MRSIKRIIALSLVMSLAISSSIVSIAEEENQTETVIVIESEPAPAPNIIYSGDASPSVNNGPIDIQEAPPVTESVEYVTDEELAEMEAYEKERARVEAKAEENREQAKKEEEARKPKLRSLGMFTLTAYCTCKKCCGKNSPEVTGKPSRTRSGTSPVQGRTVAVDKNVIPLGTHIFINGHEYVAEDTGSWVEGNDVDIFFNSHREALIFGVQKAEVFVYQ